MLAFIPNDDISDESLNGYLLRLTEENFLGSTHALLRPPGVRLKSRYTDGERSAIAQYHGLDAQRLDRLAAFPAVEGSMDAGLFLRKLVPVCPECLQLSGHIRQAWHHQLFTACPLHQVLLIAECPACESSLELNRGAVSQCGCGCDLSLATALPADAANLLISSILLRTGENQQVLSGLNHASGVPQDIDKFLLFLANLTLKVPHRKNVAIDFKRAVEINQACYVMAQDLLTGFRTFVLAKVQAANQADSRQFIRHLGAWYRELNASFNSAAYAPLRAIVTDIILGHAHTPINRKMKYIGAELLGLKATFTANEAARLLGSSPDRIMSYVKTGQLPGKVIQGALVDFCLIDRAAVEALQQAAEGLVTSKDLLRILNITRRVRARLLESGTLNRVPESDRPLFAKGEFLKKDVQRLIDVLAEAPVPVVCHTTLGIEDISAKRFSYHQACEVYRLIFTGQIKPVSRTPEVQGLAAFGFDQEEILGHLRQDSALFELTITDLTKMTRWKHENIKAWVEQGHLGARVESLGRSRRVFISVVDLLMFLSTHIVVAEVAERLGSKSVHLTNSLASKGAMVRGGHVTSEGTQRGALISTDALIKLALGRAAGESPRKASDASMGATTRCLTMADLADGLFGAENRPG